MAFNADYWIAIAAAAPVLALANTVTLTNWSRNYLEYAEAKAASEAEMTGERRPLPLHRVARGRRMALLNFSLQVEVTFLALVCLQYGRTFFPAWLATASVTISLILVAAFALAAGEFRRDTYLLTVTPALIPPLEPDTDDAVPPTGK